MEIGTAVNNTTLFYWNVAFKKEEPQRVEILLWCIKESLRCNRFALFCCGACVFCFNNVLHTDMDADAVKQALIPATFTLRSSCNELSIATNEHGHLTLLEPDQLSDHMPETTPTQVTISAVINGLIPFRRCLEHESQENHMPASIAPTMVKAGWLTFPGAPV